MNYILSTKEKQIQQDVQLTDIIALSEFNPREKVEENLVKELAKVDSIPSIKLAKFPKLTDKLIIIDGNHRYNSRFLRNEDTISAFIFEYNTEEELFKDATLANLYHGKMLTKKEKITSISKIMETMELNNKQIVYSELASEIGGMDRRELQKIDSWRKVKKVLGDDAIGLDFNTSKGDILYRLLKNVKTEEEFKNFYKKYGSLNFIELNTIINKYIKGEPIDSNEEIVNKIDGVNDITEEINEEEFNKVNEEIESYKSLNLEESLEPNLKELNKEIEKKQVKELNVMELLDEINFLIEEKAYIIDFAIQNNQQLEKTGYVTKLVEIRNRINKLESSLNG